MEGQLRMGRLPVMGSISDMDGVSAAPNHHHVLFENEVVRVIESVIRVGERTPPHAHPHPRVMYALSGSTYVRRDPDGVVMEDSGFESRSDDHPRVMWSGPTQLHTIENTRDEDLVVIAVEVLRGT